MEKTYIRDGIEYNKSNHRMLYNSEFHENHKKPWTLQEVVYLCGMYESATKRDIALALGRTENTCLTKAHDLKKRGDFERYKSMFKEE